MVELIKVLIVDTPGSFDELYGDFQTLPGFQSKFAGSVTEALKKIATDPPHIIIVDVPSFPDGEKIADLAKKFDIPLVYASAFENFAFERVPEGARIINKPFRGFDLKVAVRGQLFKRGINI